jgi:DNA-binding response OmpR family regulator
MAILKAPFILVLNENRPVRNLLQTILKHAGYGVLAVGAESEAARLMRHRDSGIRLLVMDQDRLSGPAWPGQFQSGEGVKLLYLTSFRSLPERVADALTYPESGFLAKPFSPKALLNLVEALIGAPGGSRTDPSWTAEGGDWSYREAPAAVQQQG